MTESEAAWYELHLALSQARGDDLSSLPTKAQWLKRHRNRAKELVEEFENSVKELYEERREC